MKKSFYSLVCIFIVCIYSETFCQEGKQYINIMFWNVENLFDPFDDSLTNDDEFTPEGVRHWTWTKFKHKINNIYKVIAITGGWNPPDIIGLCEVENRWVLEQLTRNTPLSKYEYWIIHGESPDPRGIDVGLLYLPGSFKPVYSEQVRLKELQQEGEPTRDIFYVKGLIPGPDTLHLFINHWPSRYQGETGSAYKRCAAAELLKRHIDSLFRLDPSNRIIIFGDFNDEPGDHSISGILAAGSQCDDIQTDALYNLSVHAVRPFEGTQKYQGKWFFFDQFIVSGSILTSFDSCCMKVTDFNFLLEKDENFVGSKPFRTYYGYHYKGGFSDHLPVCLELYYK